MATAWAAGTVAIIRLAMLTSPLLCEPEKTTDRYGILFHMFSATVLLPLPLILEESAAAASWQVCAGVCQTYRRHPA
jgi:hypothetical protein